MNNFATISLSTLIASLLITTPASASKMHAAEDGFGNNTFSNSARVDDDTLSHQRGKFISAGGLTFDFALQTRVLVDGIAQNDVKISSSALDIINQSNLQRIVQIGQGNTLEALNEIQNNPNIVTVIQNSQDDRVIQTINQLDLTVSNIDTFRTQQTLNNIDYQQVISLQ
jgi:hypothetical protein